MIHKLDAIVQTSGESSRTPVPARSLRGRSASLRTLPDGVGNLVPKRLISQVLSASRSAILVIESIFLPALRESGSIEAPGAPGEYGVAARQHRRDTEDGGLCDASVTRTRCGRYDSHREQIQLRLVRGERGLSSLSGI